MKTPMKTLLIGLLVLLPAVAYAQDAHDCTIIVLDASGSMRSTMKDSQGREVRKIDAAKQALKKIAEQMPKDEWVGLLVFSAQNLSKDQEWLYPLGKLDVRKLQQAIDIPEPGGGTPLSWYMEGAANELMKQRERQHYYGTYRLLVVTDGEDDDRGRCEKITKLVLERKLRIDAIGVAMDNRHILATRSDSYRTAQNPEELQRVLSAVFAEIPASGIGKMTLQESYELTSGFPDDVAQSIIEQLSRPAGNHPIGTQPPAPAVDNPSPPSQGTVAQTSTPAPVQVGTSGFTVFLIFVGSIFVIVVAILFFKWLLDGGCC